MKTNQEGWEIEFDKEFLSYGKSYPEGSDRSEVLSISELKAFIAKVREQAIRDTLKRVKKLLPYGVIFTGDFKKLKNALLGGSKK